MIAKVVSQCRSVFILGRKILDGVLFANEVVDLAKRRKDKCFLFKVYFEKAYDFLSWGFLSYMMGHMGFDEVWISWMVACIASNSVYVLVNGSPTSNFRMQKVLDNVILFLLSFFLLWQKV